MGFGNIPTMLADAPILGLLLFGQCDPSPATAPPARSDRSPHIDAFEELASSLETDNVRRLGRVPIAEILTARDERGRSIAHYVCAYDARRVAAQLAQYIELWTVKDSLGYQPLHYAAMAGLEETVQAVAAEGASHDGLLLSKTRDGLTPLHMLLINGKTLQVSTSIRNGIISGSESTAWGDTIAGLCATKLLTEPLLDLTKRSPDLLVSSESRLDWKWTARRGDLRTVQDLLDPSLKEPTAEGRAAILARLGASSMRDELLKFESKPPARARTPFNSDTINFILWIDGLAAFRDPRGRVRVGITSAAQIEYVREFIEKSSVLNSGKEFQMHVGFDAISYLTKNHVPLFTRCASSGESWRYGAGSSRFDGIVSIFWSKYLNQVLHIVSPEHSIPLADLGLPGLLRGIRMNDR